MKILNTMTLDESKTLLKDVRAYADMTKKLGLRGRNLFKGGLNGTKSYVVEYFPALGKDSAWTEAQSVFSKSFWVSPEKGEVVFIENSKIKGGMKVYSDDNMVDLSYKKVENLMQR